MKGSAYIPTVQLTIKVALIMLVLVPVITAGAEVTGASALLRRVFKPDAKLAANAAAENSTP